ncbi:7TM diverse intracellular signaling domain-containing protein [Fulvivirga sediminis]|uniref:Receptor n=1 Tax=Fulvivirga sediminis TaxID=2803949 RepID=A0A937F4S6_9BACT|nr:7TM diverse intracellular signaling domain-containing protein [Fulvivirga sediminis]MBL3654689.1 receptor [Fulvivirga sediminis]
MKLLRNFSISIFFLLICAEVNGQIIRLNSEQEEKIVAINHLKFYQDATGKTSFEKLKHEPELFRSNQNFAVKDFDPSSTYWVKMKVRFPEGTQKQWIIEFYDQTIDHIEAYIPNKNGKYKKLILGDRYNFDQKPFLHKNFEIPLDSELKGTQEFYFMFRSATKADVRIALRTINRFIHYSLNEYYLYGLFYGMILIISLYNLLIYTAIRESKYLFYTFYILSVGVYAMCVDGIAYQYLWPNWPDWNQIAYGFALFLLIFWSLVFGQRFLNTKVRAPKLHIILQWTIVLRTALFLYALFIDNSMFEKRNIEIIPLSLIFYAGIYVLIRGYKPARFFVMAYGMLFLGFLFKALLNLTFLPFNIITYYSLHICFLFEMLFLSFALSDRVRILKDNRDRALKRTLIQHQENVKLKDKVNKELENLVAKRTKQLEEKNLLLEQSNQKLYEQTNEINKINSMLDLDNWKLKNNIKEILQDRLINKNLTPEQFNNIFPDKISCYKFLEKLKWGAGYECQKCGNTKYSDGQSKLARRCSKCGYDESITSHTVFHRIKFPIEKAFYILYITNNKDVDYTLDELSEMLDLRRNTVWNFKKKIESVYQSADSSNILIHDLFTAHLN